MLSKMWFAVSVLGSALTVPALSQEGYRSEATVQGTGSFVRDTTENGVRQSATNSGGFLANYRFFFNEHHGVEVNYGYAQNTQSYGLGGGALGVKSRSHEVSAAYVFRFRLARLPRLTPFALAGVGGLVFDPKDDFSSRSLGATTQARAAFVYGGGADFNVTKRVFVRAQYRGFVYNSPTFDASSLGPERITHRAEPSAGVGFRF
jgi:outer membrane immunogenic protein